VNGGSRQRCLQFRLTNRQSLKVSRSSLAAGDSGAAGCDNSAAEATLRHRVNAFASTPYNVAVGRNRFQAIPTPAPMTRTGISNTSTFGSALSYVPEIPWNDSCAGLLVSNYLGYSRLRFDQPLQRSAVWLVFLDHGRMAWRPQRLRDWRASTPGVVGGTCQGWPTALPAILLGNPSDACVSRRTSLSSPRTALESLLHFLLVRYEKWRRRLHRRS